MPDDLRYTQDNFYRKGQHNVTFAVEPVEAELDEAARRRALQQLLWALREETGLKISAFIDVWRPEAEDERSVDAQEVEETDEAEAKDLSAQAEFVIYNKLGVTSLAKLRRFMEEHLRGDVHPRIVLVDSKTGQKFHASDFTIQYLFHNFVAHRPPKDWERLRELLQSEDRGYAELTSRTASWRRPVSTQKRQAIWRRIARQPLQRMKSEERGEFKMGDMVLFLLEDEIAYGKIVDFKRGKDGAPPVAHISVKGTMDEAGQWHRYPDFHAFVPVPVGDLTKADEPYSFYKEEIGL